MKKRYLNISIIVTSIFLISVVGISLYRFSPNYVFNQYVTQINNKNYKEAYQLFYKNDSLNEFSEEYIVTYLERYFKDNGFLRLEKGEIPLSFNKGAQNKDIYYYPVTYLFGQYDIQLSVGMIKEEKGWKILFPFKTEELKVYAPTGSTVYVQNQKIKVSRQDDYVKFNLFPGKYSVKIEYPTGTKEAYSQIVDFPKERDIFSPYNAYTIQIKAPLHTKVELAEITQENTDGTVKFKNIIEGEYALKVYDPYGIREEYNTVIKVGSQATEFKVGSMPLSQEGYNKISQFTNQFYQNYIQGIENQSADFLIAHVEEDILEQVTEEYRSWFIDYKDIQDAKVTIQVQEMQLKDTAEVKLTILEIIQMTNKDDEGLTEYQLVLKWDNILNIFQKDYKIKERVLTESLVSYKDEEGKWIQY